MIARWYWQEVKCAKSHHSLNPATAWWLMGGLQVSTKLCHSNTPVGQVSLNGILNIIILTQPDDGGEEVYDVSWSSRKVWIKNCKKFQHCLNKPSPIPPNSETFGSLNYMAAPPSWISDSIHVFWVGSDTISTFKWTIFLLFKFSCHSPDLHKR